MARIHYLANGSIDLEGLILLNGKTFESLQCATATVAVGPLDGEFQDIQAAIDAIASTGGLIFLNVGVYNLAVSLVMPPVPIIIRGCGAATVLNLGAHNVPLFTFPAGMPAGTLYSLEDVLITGTSLSAQHAISAQSDVDIFLKSVATSGIASLVDSSVVAPSVVVADCPSLSVKSIWTSTVVGFLEIANSSITVTGAVAIGGSPQILISATQISGGTISFAPNSIIDGVRRTDVAGSTTGAFVTVATINSTMGLTGVGTIKNTGANGMEVRETVTDIFGVTDNVVTPVASGMDYMLDLLTNFATAKPPYAQYNVAVRHPTTLTTFALHLVSQGGVQ